MEHHLLAELVIVLGFSVAVAIPLRRIGLPMLLGYMLVGIVVGPHVLDLLPHEEETRLLADLGVVFLMFMVGLEFSVSTMVRARRLVFGRGGAQVITTAVAAALALWLSLGVGLSVAALMGGALAMSSTAIGLKLLSDRGELNSQHGRSVVGILLFQDLATLPFLIMIPALAGGGQGAWGVAANLGRAAAAFLILLALGRWALRPVMDRVAAVKSDELFVLTTLLAVLGAAFGADYAGLSPPIGAFLVGMMMGETRYKHQVADDIRPFRDVLLGLFFVTIGMQLDLHVLPRQWLAVLLVFVGLTVVKAPLIIALMRALSVERAEAVRIGVVLGHGGEFGLLITTLALELGLVGARVGQPILAALILSMVVAPFLIRANHLVAKWLVPSTWPSPTPGPRDEQLDDHVIVCGYGHVGRHVATLLQMRDVPLVAVEKDPDQIRDAERCGHPVLFGDASRRSVLQGAGIDRARCVVVTLDDTPTARRVVEHVRTVRAELPILVSVTKSADVESVMDAGATIAIPEGLSASLMVGEYVLRLVGLGDHEIEGAIAELRAELGPDAPLH